MMQAELTALNVTKLYGNRGVKGGVAAVDDVSFTVRTGDFTAVVGESGSGKSTLARMLLKLIEPTTGQLFFNGRTLTEFNRDELKEYRRCVQAVLQDPSGSLNPRRTIGRAVSEVIRFHQLAKGQKAADRIASETLEKVGLDPEVYFHRFPHELSGGQRQRVLIARAVAVRPRLIIADEAVSALDVSVKAGVLKLMRDLQEELGIGYVFITHDLPVVKKVADYIYVMRSGQVVEHGTKTHLFTSPSHPYTRELLNAAPRLQIAQSNSTQA